MKKDNLKQIKNIQNPKPKKFTAATDILVVKDVVQANMQRLSQRPRRKRRINYAKKIMNDSFVLNV